MHILKEIQYNPMYSLILLQCKVEELDELTKFIESLKEKKKPDEKIISIFAVENLSSSDKAE